VVDSNFMCLELLKFKGLGFSQAEVVKELRHKIGFLTGLCIGILKLFGVETYFLNNFGAHFKRYFHNFKLDCLEQVGQLR